MNPSVFLSRVTSYFNFEQDGRLVPAYFSPNYKYFDQLLQTAQNKNYCFDISFQRVFTNIKFTIDFCTLCKKVSQYSVEKFLSHSAEKFRRGTLLCFTKIPVSKKFMDKKGGRRKVVSQFSVENFLSHSAENFRRGTLLCCVSENFL